ncbi:hypothetical protein J6590_075049 [Homalodisca vitripennis]|nr:hypothetical protein J6590_075049 [Homalodisca vitripennis]
MPGVYPIVTVEAESALSVKQNKVSSKQPSDKCFLPLNNASGSGITLGHKCKHPSCLIAATILVCQSARTEVLVFHPSDKSFVDIGFTF